MSSYSCSNNPVLHRPVEPGQYTAVAYTEKLALDGIAPSVGSVGDAYDCQSVSASSRKDGVVLAGAF